MTTPAVAYPDRSVVSCHDCGALYRRIDPGVAAKAKCPRCGALLYYSKPNSIDRSLNLHLAALIFLVLANIFPFMTFKLEGREQESTLISGVIDFYNQGLWPLAALVLLATVLIPFVKIVSTIYVLAMVQYGRTTRRLATIFRYIEVMHPWAMMEVYLLGVLVAIVKLSDMATIEFGTALWCFVILIILLAAGESALDPGEVWDRLDRRRADKGTGPAQAPPDRRVRPFGCHSCGLVTYLDRTAEASHPHCERCGGTLHWRKTNSLARSWALVITGFILYIPANLYPIMTVISFGKGAPDTIMSGVIHLIEAEMWPLALLVFFASVTVPVMKLLGMSYLLISVQRGSHWRPRDRTLLYRIVEAVGRWSMIDIFMISILVALVKLGSIATIEPGVGATSFAAVVVITMIAAMTFDPRLIWDAMEERTDGGAAR
ncbi:MAG: paraquat-inducible protein A [Alphaproteobacteria bacterium]|nr:paraquat-inducible protein A [Alphaproteobacteria bacterium]